MALFTSKDVVTDEPFKRHLTPLEVAIGVQSALSALWLGLPTDQRSPDVLKTSATRLFAAIEKWWMQLRDRGGVAIVGEIQHAFGPPESTKREVRNGTLTMEAMASWLPSHSFAEALFWAWLLQPE